MKPILVLITLFLFFFFSGSNAKAQLKPELVLPVGHTWGIEDASFSPNGKYFLTASHDKTAKIWDIESGKLLRTLEGHSEGLESALWSPNGEMILTTSNDYTTKIWEFENGKLLFHVGMFGNGATWSPDGKKIATSSGIFQLQDVSINNGDIYFSEEGSFSSIPNWSPDGLKVVNIHNDTSAKIWNAETGYIIHSLKGHIDHIETAIWAPDGKSIITSSRDKTAKIWDSRTGAIQFSLEGHVNIVNWSPYGKKIATIGTSALKIWNSKNGVLLHSIEGHHEDLNSVSWSPDGKKIATTSKDNTAKIWNTENGNLITTLTGHQSNVSSAHWSPSGEIIATVSVDQSVRIWDIETGLLLQTIKSNTFNESQISYSSNGKLILIGSTNGSLRILDTESGELKGNLEGHKTSLTSAVLSPNMKKIFTASHDANSKIWSVQYNNQISDIDEKSDDDWLASWSPDNKKILTSSFVESNESKIWDSEYGKLLHRIEGCLGSWSPCGNKILTISTYGDKILIWDSEHAHLLNSFKYYTDNSIWSANWSPDGKYIYAMTINEGQIWESSTGKLIHKNIQSEYWIKSVSWSPDSKRIATASVDRTVKIYQSSTGKLLQTFDGYADDVNSVTWSADGKKIITSSDDNSAKVWELETEKLLINKDLGEFILKVANFEDDIFISSFNSQIKINKLSSGEELLQFIPIDSTNWIVLHPSGLFDASARAMEKMHYVQGLEIIDLNQLKERYWEPDLWKKVMSGEELRSVEDFNEALPLSPKVENLAINDETIEFDLIDNSGGIGKYFIYINGKEVTIGNESKDGKVFEGDRLYVNFSIKGHKYLIPGAENKITVKAYNAENYIISKGTIVLYNQKKEKIPNYKPNIFIVSGGVSDYTGNQIDLRYAAKDAEDISKSLQLGAEKLFGKEYTHSYLLSTNLERENWPTKENIQKVFNEIGSIAKSTDIIVVYLSGHGINYGGQDGDFYYLTQDAYTSSSDAYNDPAIRKVSTISSDELVELFKLIPANKQVLIIDACASGQVVEDLLTQRDISSSTIRALDRMKDRTGMYIITGSASDAVSYEASKFGQGLLTYSLLEGIKGAALREGQFVDIDILFQRAKDRVPQLAKGIGGIQEPQVFSPYGSASFDIGLLTETEKEKIPLAKEKPVFVMSTFMDADSFDDVLGLENLIDEELRTVSSKGADASLIFYDTRNFPDAYRLRGQYYINRNEINLTLNVFYGKDKIDSIDIIGDAKDLNSFVDNVIEEINRMINYKTKL